MNQPKQLISKPFILLGMMLIFATSLLATPPTARAADCSDVYTGLSSFVVDGVNANRSFYQQVSNSTDVPWEVLAAIHYRETNFSHSNPSNGQGIFQFVNKEGGPYPTGPVSDAEFVRQLSFMANRLQNDYVFRNAPSSASVTPRKMTKNEQDSTLIKNMFFSYNGRATVYANQAAQYGFTPSTQPYEGSPYVMNRFDCSRARMGIITQDYGSLNSQDTRYGAFTIYSRLKGDTYWLGQQKPYLWQPVSQEIYKDAAMTQLVPRFNGSYGLKQGQKAYVKVVGRNIGNTTWSQSNIRLGTAAPLDRTSAFADSSWVAGWRAANMKEQTTPPGSTATFTFGITAPNSPEAYSEAFSVVADGVAWMTNSSTTLDITVNPSNVAADASRTTLLPEGVLQKGDSLISSDNHTVLRLSYDGNLELWTNYIRTWQSNTAGSGAVKLVNQGGDGNMVLYKADNTAVWASQTFYPGQSSKAVLQADGNLVIYTNNIATWSTGTVTYDQSGLANTSIINGQSLLPGQSLYTANRFYELRLQEDGNLVLYSPNRAIWASGTNGRKIDKLVVQGDGNVVLYDASWKPIWSSTTSATDANRLVLQSDGNTVIYGIQAPRWATNTRLMR